REHPPPRQDSPRRTSPIKPRSNPFWRDRKGRCQDPPSTETDPPPPVLSQKPHSIHPQRWFPALPWVGTVLPSTTKALPTFAPKLDPCDRPRRNRPPPPPTQRYNSLPKKLAFASRPVPISSIY